MSQDNTATDLNEEKEKELMEEQILKYADAYDMDINLRENERNEKTEEIRGLDEDEHYGVMERSPVFLTTTGTKDTTKTYTFSCTVREASLCSLLASATPNEMLVRNAWFNECVHDTCKETYDINLPDDVICIINEYSFTPNIHLSKVTRKHMKRIVKYLKHHNGITPHSIPKPLISGHLIQNVRDPWDAHFIEPMSKRTITQIILGANYLGIASLVDLGAAKIACLIRGLPPNDIRRVLANTDDDSSDNDSDDDIYIEAINTNIETNEDINTTEANTHGTHEEEGKVSGSGYGGDCSTITTTDTSSKNTTTDTLTANADTENEDTEDRKESDST